MITTRKGGLWFLVGVLMLSLLSCGGDSGTTIDFFGLDGRWLFSATLRQNACTLLLPDFSPGATFSFTLDITQTGSELILVNPETGVRASGSVDAVGNIRWSAVSTDLPPNVNAITQTGTTDGNTITVQSTVSAQQGGSTCLFISDQVGQRA